MVDLGLPDSMSPQLRTAIASAYVTRLQMLRSTGLTFDGKRSIDEVCGFKADLTIEDYWNRYQRGGLAATVVEVFPKATWRGGVELYEDQDEENYTEFEKAWDALAERLDIVSKFMRLDILQQLGTFGVLLIGDGGPLDQELGRGTKQEGILYVEPYMGAGQMTRKGLRRIATLHEALTDVGDVQVSELEGDPRSPRFGKPKGYNIRRTDLNDPAFQKPVHPSRIIHVAERATDSDLYSEPLLKRGWNYFDSLDKVAHGGSEAFFQRANQGRVWSLDKDMQGLDEAEKQAFREQVEKFEHGMSRDVRARGLTLQTTSSDTANFAGPQDALTKLIAGTYRVPARILTGSEMGELASSQDRENWRDQVNGRRQEFAGPRILLATAKRLIEYGYLPTPKELIPKWGSVLNRTDDEKVKGAQMWANTSTEEGPCFVRSEIRKEWAGLPPLDDEQLKELQAIRDEKAEQAAAKAAPRFAEGEDELVEILRVAIESGATEIIDAIVGARA